MVEADGDEDQVVVWQATSLCPECYVGDGIDRHYEAQYAYACGYYD